MSTSRKLTSPAPPIHQGNPISLKDGLKNVRRRTPTLHQNSDSETQPDVIDKDTKLEADFTILAAKLQEINLINVPSSTLNYIIQKLTSLQIKVDQVRKPQQISENSTKWADVCDSNELDKVLDRLEKIRNLSEYNNYKQSQKLVWNYLIFYKKFSSCKNHIKNQVCLQWRSTLIGLLTPQETVMSPHVVQEFYHSVALDHSKKSPIIQR